MADETDAAAETESAPAGAEANAWPEPQAAAAGGANPGVDDPADERILNQDEIDSLLGFDLADARGAFDALPPVPLPLDRLETNPRFAAIARPANAAILVKLRIDMEDRGGRIELLLPYATLEPIRKMLLQQFMGEKFGRDNIWESHLATELWTTQMEVRAVLDEQQVSLKRVLELKVGDTLMLNATADHASSASLGGPDVRAAPPRDAPLGKAYDRGTRAGASRRRAGPAP